MWEGRVVSWQGGDRNNDDNFGFDDGDHRTNNDVVDDGDDHTNDDDNDDDDDNYNDDPTNDDDDDGDKMIIMMIMMITMLMPRLPNYALHAPTELKARQKKK